MTGLNRSKSYVLDTKIKGAIALQCQIIIRIFNLNSMPCDHYFIGLFFLVIKFSRLIFGVNY